MSSAINFPHRPPFSVTAALVERAAVIHGIEPWQIFRRNRTRKFSHPRFGVIWALSQLGLSSCQIRDQLGFEDHTSVLYGLKWANRRREEDRGFREYTDDLLSLALATVTIPPRFRLEAEAA